MRMVSAADENRKCMMLTWVRQKLGESVEVGVTEVSWGRWVRCGGGVSG